MRSVRLDQELEARLEEAARVTGEPLSEIIRAAVRRRCDEVLGARLDRKLSDVIGLVSAGGSSRKTGREFARLLRDRAAADKSLRRAGVRTPRAGGRAKRRRR